MSVVSFRPELHPLLIILFVLVLFVVKVVSLFMFSVTLDALLLIKRRVVKNGINYKSF